MNPKLFWVCTTPHELTALAAALAELPARAAVQEDGSTVKVTTTDGYDQIVRFDARATSARIRATVNDDAPVEAAIAVMALWKKLGGRLTDDANAEVTPDSTAAIGKALGVQVRDVSDHAEAYGLVKPAVKWDRIASGLSVSF